MHTLTDRIEGCLVGAAIGFELGWTRYFDHDQFKAAGAADVLALTIRRSDSRRFLPAAHPETYPGIYPVSHLRPVLDLAVRTYVRKQGRVTPEDFGRELRDDRAFYGRQNLFLLLFHATQELLNEGMNPRISGMGIAPSGFMCAAMPAVGIFHHHDPEYAYLDGVELAAVCQPRLGADWSGLAAAAIAAALDPANDPAAVVQTVLDLALANNRDLHAELNRCVAATSGWFSGDRRAAGVDRWRLGFPWMQVERNDFAPHPLRYVLPLLKPFDGEPEPLMSVLLSQPQFNAQLVTPVLAGAITGARHGREVFPPEWRHWAEPMARPWFPILRAVRKRRQQEASLIEVHETLLRRRRNGMSLLEDKLYGCLLAGSIGNAMGSPVEGWSYEEIEAKYPGGIRTILDPARLEAEDDNQQMMLVLEAYLARDGRPVMGRHLARTWAEQWPRDKFWRFADANSYDLCRAGWDPRITGQWNPMAATTTMCFEPVGLYHLADPEYAAVDARAIACMQQRGLELRVVGTLTSTVAEALRPEATVASVCAAALRAAPRDRLVLPERLRTKDGRTHASCRDYFAACLDVAAKYDDVLAARKEMYARCRVAHFWHAANIEIAAWGLALFKIANGDVRHAAIGGTNIGRDADSVAGRAAMLAGALSGAGNVPKEWIRMFKPAVLRRIRSRARAMARLIAHPKLERLRQRQEIGPPCAR